MSHDQRISNTFLPPAPPQEPNTTLSGQDPQMTPAGPHRSGRILGVDLARGLALLGMITAHFGLITSPELLAPSTWGGIVNGRPSILFAILAGGSLAIITGRATAFTGERLAQARVKILVRALCIFLIGSILTSLNVYIAVILQTYGVLFVCALAFLSVRRRWLIAFALSWAVIGPVLVAVLEPLLGEIGISVPLAERLIWDNYPVLTWIPYVIIGLAIGRTDPTARANQVFLLLLGIIFAVMGYTAVLPFSDGPETPGDGGFSYSGSVEPDWEGSEDWEDCEDEGYWEEETPVWEVIEMNLAGMNTAEPHSNTTFEIIGSGGFGVACLALCLLITPAVRIIFAPIIAMGSMSLTIYTLHVISFRFVQEQVMESFGLSAAPWLITIVIAGAFALIWQKTLGKGPLERLVNRVVQAITTGTHKH